jgi:hypothetical protein
MTHVKWEVSGNWKIESPDHKRHLHAFSKSLIAHNFKQRARLPDFGFVVVVVVVFFLSMIPLAKPFLPVSFCFFIILL